MKKFTLNVTFGFFVFTFFMAAFSTSCKKDQTCHGTVHVNDTAGRPVANATVKLAAPSVNGDVVYSQLSDGSGDAEFEVKLPAIFDVKATKATFPPAFVGTGVLRLDEPGKTGEVTVTIKP